MLLNAYCVTLEVLFFLFNMYYGIFSKNFRVLIKIVTKVYINNAKVA